MSLRRTVKKYFVISDFVYLSRLSAEYRPTLNSAETLNVNEGNLNKENNFN